MSDDDGSYDMLGALADLASNTVIPDEEYALARGQGRKRSYGQVSPVRATSSSGHYQQYPTTKRNSQEEYTPYATGAASSSSSSSGSSQPAKKKLKKSNSAPYQTPYAVPQIRTTTSALVRSTSAPPKLKPPRRGSRLSKGLRHFSIKVCEKLSQSGETTYNHIANLLVAEGKPTPDEVAEAAREGKETKYDEKNIRRRIYDALNVLMALDIITKDNKKIRWQGIHLIPERDIQHSEAMIIDINTRLMQKKKLLEEMTLQYMAVRNLMNRNKKQLAGATAGDSKTATVAAASTSDQYPTQLELPFILVSSKVEADVLCKMTDNRDEVSLHYQFPFAMHDDNALLRQMGFADYESNIPMELRSYLPLRFPNHSRTPAVPDVVNALDSMSATTDTAAARPRPQQQPPRAVKLTDRISKTILGIVDDDVNMTPATADEVVATAPRVTN